MAIPTDVQGEALAAMALASLIFQHLHRKGLLSSPEAIELLDASQLRLADMFPNHPGLPRATAIFESLLRVMSNLPPSKDSA